MGRSLKLGGVLESWRPNLEAINRGSKIK